MYIDQEKLICTRQSLSELPETHFNTLMRHFLKPVFGIKGISATGTRHCVGIPDKLTSTVLSKYFLGPYFSVDKPYL